jgi:hypothetical protein
MLSTGSRLTTGLDLASIGEEVAQKIGLLVVYDINVVCAKSTCLATRDIFSSSRGRLSPSTRCFLFAVLELFVWQSHLPAYNF